MRIFSAIRPTGEIHIGNYLGSIKEWLFLQDKNECYFCIADLHAITTPYNPKTLRKNILSLASTYLALGIDSLFIQSEVKEHTELAWLINTIVPVSLLQRMTQFKDKSKEHKEYINAGLLNYPVLMAADILLYKSEKVPVGQDQKQHIEFTRDIALKFNKQFGETFVLPEILVSKNQAKIMSLKDPTKKMSKTGDPKACIFLKDKEEEIIKKIMGAKTDTEKIIKFDAEHKKGISNLLSIYSAFSDKSIALIEEEYKNKSYAEFKKDLGELLVLKLRDFKKKYNEYLNNSDYVLDVLDKGKERAQEKASLTIKEVRKKMGLD